jgi:uncharacterized membrane protein
MANTEIHRVLLTMSVTHSVSFSFASIGGLGVGLGIGFLVIQVCQSVLCY